MVGMGARTSAVAAPGSAAIAAVGAMTNRTAPAAQRSSYARWRARRTTGGPSLTAPYAPNTAATGGPSTVGSSRQPRMEQDLLVIRQSIASPTRPERNQPQLFFLLAVSTRLTNDRNCGDLAFRELLLDQIEIFRGADCCR